MSKKLSHIDEQGNPAMVDVSHKAITTRTATAQAIVWLGEEIMSELSDHQFSTKKGSVLHTAIIAATMAVKQTDQLIPLCHNLPISSCKTDIQALDDAQLQIRCTVKTTGQTGVEMEALHGASVAALTIYDMCKAMSHDMVIKEIVLLKKTGGKNDYERQTS